MNLASTRTPRLRGMGAGSLSLPSAACDGCPGPEWAVRTARRTDLWLLTEPQRAAAALARDQHDPATTGGSGLPVTAPAVYYGDGPTAGGTVPITDLVRVYVPAT